MRKVLEHTNPDVQNKQHASMSLYFLLNRCVSSTKTTSFDTIKCFTPIFEIFKLHLEVFTIFNIIIFFLWVAEAMFVALQPLFTITCKEILHSSANYSLGQQAKLSHNKV